MRRRIGALVVKQKRSTERESNPGPRRSEIQRSTNSAKQEGSRNLRAKMTFYMVDWD